MNTILNLGQTFGQQSAPMESFPPFYSHSKTVRLDAQNFIYDYRTTMEGDKSKFTRKHKKVVVELIFSYERGSDINKMPSKTSVSGNVQKNFTSRRLCKTIRVEIPKSCSDFKVIENSAYKVTDDGKKYYYEQSINTDFYDHERLRNKLQLPSFEIEINDENLGGIKVNADVTYFDEDGAVINRVYSHLQMDMVALLMMEELDDLKSKVSRNIGDTLSNVLTTIIGALGTWVIMNLKRKLKIAEERAPRNA